MTSNVAGVHPFQVLLAAGEGGLRVASKVQAEQVRAVAVERDPSVTCHRHQLDRSHGQD